MGRNIEIKARIPESEFDRIRNIARNIATEPPLVLMQTDTFYLATHDRLKIREFEDGSAELIAYTRSDVDGPKVSSYVRSPIVDPQTMKLSLERSIGIRGVVKKRRELFIFEQTRIHLDVVEMLGSYIELEVVLRSDQDDSTGTTVANELTAILGIDSSWLVAGAYIDWIEKSSLESAN